MLGHVAKARLAFPQVAGRFAPKERHLEVGVHAGQEFARGERLRQVVVGLGVEALHPRIFARARRQHDDGQVAQLGVVAHFAQEAEAVEARHHDVGQHQIGLARPHRRQRLHAVRDRLHLPSRSEQPADVSAHVGVVVGDQDARSGRPSLEGETARLVGAIVRRVVRVPVVRQPA